MKFSAPYDWKAIAQGLRDHEAIRVGDITVAWPYTPAGCLSEVWGERLYCVRSIDSAITWLKENL